jgi:Zn-dependent oligopeptidase
MLHQVPDGCKRLSTVQMEAQNDILELAAVRKSMAELVGSPSYMHYKLASAGLTQQPEVVQGFLDNVRAAHQDKCEQELQELLKFARDTGLVKGPQLGAWDYGVCRINALIACLQQCDLPSRELQFSASGVMRTLFGVVEKLFGVRFVAEQADPRCVVGNYLVVTFD